MRRLNAFLDRLPRTRFCRRHRPVAAFRTCGITGFYLALVALFGGGLLAGRSLVVLAGLALVSGLSFFVYTYLRKWITGREELVLLEHVWFALAANAGALHALNLPVLPYLDLVAVAMCPFLAMGRVGCTLVGCCHGLPSSVGITYTEECAKDGFPRHLLGIRLFPAPALEGIGLALIGGVGLVSLPFAPAGRVFAWFLLAYAIMRFGLEGIRGDPRPQFLGLSQARWMALAEVAFVLSLNITESLIPSAWVLAPLVLTLAGCLAYKVGRDPRRRFLSAKHLSEVAGWLTPAQENRTGFATAQPVAGTTSRGVTIAVSPLATRQDGTVHISLSLPENQSDLSVLCEFAIRAFPSLVVDSAVLSQGRILHVVAAAATPAAEMNSSSTHTSSRARALYGAVLLRSLLDESRPSEPGAPPSAESGRAADKTRVLESVPVGPVPWYLTPDGRDAPP